MLSQNSSVVTWGCYWIFTSATPPDVRYEPNKTLKMPVWFPPFYLHPSIHPSKCVTCYYVSWTCGVLRTEKQGWPPRLWARPSRVRRGQCEEQKSERLRWFLGSQHAAIPAFLQPADGRRASVTPQQICGFLPQAGRLSGDDGQRYRSGIVLMHVKNRACQFLIACVVAAVILWITASKIGNLNAKNLNK